MSYDLLNGKRIYQLDLQATLASDLKFAIDNEGFNEARYITLGQLSTLVGHPALSLGTPNGLHLIAGTQILSLELANTLHAGAIPTLPNDATKYLNGVGAWTVPAGGGGGVTPIDDILHWDGTKYTPYNDLYDGEVNRFFYIGNERPNSDNELNYNGILRASQFEVWAGDNSISTVQNYLSFDIRYTNTSFRLANINNLNLITAYESFGGGVYESRSIYIGDNYLFSKEHGEYILIDDHNQLFNINMTTVRLNKGTVNKFLYLDSNKNITYVDAPGGGDYILPISTAAVLGGVKIGSGVSVAADGTISVSTSYEAPLSAGTILQYYRGDKSWQTLNTTAVVESTNLYFTIARARTSISLTTSGTSGAATYNSTTGVINIPNYATGGITLASLSATAPLSYNNTTGVFSISQATTSTNGYLSYTDWNTFNNKVSFPGFGTTHTTAAYGDHTHTGYLTNVTLSVPTGFTVSNNLTSGVVALGLGFTSGYSLPTNTAQTNWNTAYSWGNHAGLYDKYTSWSLTADGATIAVTGVNSTSGAKGLQLIAGTNITISGVMNLAGQMALTINSTASGANGVTSVGLALPTSVFSISNSPITTTGTLTGAFISQNAGKVFAAPSTSDGIPTFRALDINHLPTGITGTTVAFGNHLHTGVYALAAHTHTLASLTDVTITSIAANEILKWNGTRWINNTLAEAGISAVGHTHTYDNYVSWELQVAGASFDVTSGNYINFGSGVRGALLTWDATYHKVEVSALRWYDVAPRQYSTTSTIATTSDGFSVYLDDAGVYEIEVVLDAQVSNNTGGAKFNIYSSMTPTFVGHVMGVATSNSVTSYKIDSLSATYGLFLLDANGKGQIIIKGVYTATTGGHAVAVLFQKVGSGTIYINAGSFIRAVKIS